MMLVEGREERKGLLDLDSEGGKRGEEDENFQGRWRMVYVGRC